jgi:hypothetical protein
MLSGEETNTKFIVLGLTQSGLEPMIYCTRGKHANHYSTDVVIYIIDTNIIYIVDIYIIYIVDTNIIYIVDINIIYIVDINILTYKYNINLCQNVI